jgi:hypothetical protein
MEDERAGGHRRKLGVASAAARSGGVAPARALRICVGLQGQECRHRLDLRISRVDPQGAVGVQLGRPEVVVTQAAQGIGVQRGQVGFGVSFVMLQSISDGDDDNITGLNLGGDYAVDPHVRMFAQLGLSLEDDSDGTSFGLGTRATF